MTAAISPPARIGFVGLGHLGEPASRAVHKAGFRLALYDLNKDTLARLAAEYSADTPATLEDLARGCDVVITCLPDGRIVRDVVLGEQGIAAGMSPSSLLIDMGSSAPLGTRALGEELARRGLRMMDAPVSGSVRGAVNAQLIFMIGGAPEDFERCKPLLSAMGRQQFHLGPLGSGHALKCLNNYIAAAGYIAASEALVAGRRFGLDPQAMLDVINVSSGGSYNTQNKFSQQVLSRKWGSGFSLGLMAKDVRTALELAELTDTPFRLGRHCRELWNEAEQELGAAADHTEMTRIIEEAAGVQLSAVKKS